MSRQGDQHSEDSFGHYRIVRLIGEGGMGKVYLAFDTRLDRRVAIKVVRADQARDATGIDRFLVEAQAAARIHHPGITTIYATDISSRGDPYIVMEYLQGDNLHDLVQKHGRLPARTIVDIGAQVAWAMAAAHDMDILHRDLKPHNVVLTSKGAVKILDFGIAKLLQDEPDEPGQTMRGTIMGTPGYMSPEQVRDSSKVDRRSDIYSLGCVLYEMACGRPPFTGRTPGDIFIAHVTTPAPDPRSLAPDLPDPLAELILAMLAKEREKRPQSMHDVASALDGALDGVAAGLSDSEQDDDRPASSLPVRRPHGKSSTGGSTLLVASDTFTAGDWPRPGAGIDVVPDTSTTDQPGVTVAVKPGGAGTAARPSQPTPARPIDIVLGALPSSIKPFARDIESFLATLFASWQASDPHVWRLFGARLPHAEQYAFFALFVEDSADAMDAPLGRMGTQTFMQSARSLDENLAALGDGPKVVIAVAASAELGPGVREKILAYRTRFEAFVVPLYAGEIRRACRAGALAELFHDRLADFHTLPDPYAPRSASPDATQFFGMRALVNDLVASIRDGGAIIAITGPPGSGKSALVMMAEYGLGEHEFVYIRCPATARRTPRELIQKIAAALPEPASIDDGQAIAEAVGTITLQLAPSPLRAGKRVLVLEDADWLIDALAAPGTPADERDELRAMWSALAEHCQGHGATVVVTSIRGFLLSQRVIRGWDNPVRPHAIEVDALGEGELGEMVRDLGVPIQLRYSRAALRHIHHQSAGNVYTARVLCSRIVRAVRQKRGHHVLAAIAISKADVTSAAAELASLGRTYDNTVMPWLDEREKEVLRHVAMTAPGSAQAVQHALGDALGEAEARASFSVLQDMGLVTARSKRPGRPWQRRRHRVSIPLMAAWIEQNLTQPSEQRQRRRRERIRRITIGLSITAVLGGIYLAWFQTGRGLTDSARHDACSYQVDHPQRGAPGESLLVYMHRRCTEPPRATWSLVPIAAPARITMPPGQDESGGDSMYCDADRLHCWADRSVTLLDAAQPDYRFALSVDRQELVTFAIAKDALAMVKRKVELVFQIIALLPLAFGLFLAFHREVASSIKQLFGALAGRGGGSAGGASKDGAASSGDDP